MRTPCPTPLRLAWLAGLLAFAATVAATEPAPRVFTSASFAALRQTHAGQPFVVAFWSVSCEPCAEEIMVLTELHRAFPSVPVVLVAADPPSQRAAVVRFLARHALGRIETWQFGDEPVERLRYSVEKSWTGELPRLYVFEADSTCTARSGVVETAWLRTWMTEAQQRGRK